MLIFIALQRYYIEYLKLYRRFGDSLYKIVVYKNY